MLLHHGNTASIRVSHDRAGCKHKSSSVAAVDQTAGWCEAAMAPA
jgi:hypothetical protein